MKTFYYLSGFALSLLLFACNSPQNNESEMKGKSNGSKSSDERSKVMLVLDKYRLANETENLNLAKEIWANSDEIVVIGTSSDEKLIGWNAIETTLKRQFDKLDNILISVRDQYVKVNDSHTAAWFSEILNYNYIQDGVAQGFEGLRFTGVMEKINGEWKIVQSHISIPGSTDQ
jgi:hypothetical protein